MVRFTVRAILAALLLATPLVAAAQGELVVYCTVQEEWCRPMVAAFEKTTGIKVLMTRKSSGEFYAQLKAEADDDDWVLSVRRVHEVGIVHATLRGWRSLQGVSSRR